jgi:hypothetical protein
VVDPDNSGRYLQVRGDAELVTAGAEAHLDTLTRKYTRYPRFYSYVHPDSDRLRETWVMCRIHARRVTTDAIHA